MKFWNKPQLSLCPIAHIYNFITVMHCQIQRISWPAQRFYDFVFGGLTGWAFLFLGTKGELSAEGAKLRLPKARSPSRLGGLGERRMLPSGVWGGAPETDVILNISSPDGVHFGILVISHF